VGRNNDFSSPVRKLLSERAGYTCSFPDCDRSTIGPSVGDSTLSIRSGWACHIYPAAAGGPRGAHTPSGFDVAGEGNGIWMCETHGSQIDKNDGEGFPPQLLLKWKGNAEAKARLRQSSASKPSVKLDAFEFPSQTLKGMRLGSFRLELSTLTVIEANDPLPLNLIAHCLGLTVAAPSRLSSLVYGGKIDFTVFYSPGHRPPTRVALEANAVRYWNGNQPRESMEGFYEARLLDLSTLRSMIPVDDEMNTTERNDDHILTGSAHPDPLIADRIAHSLQTQDTIGVRDIRRSARGWEVSNLRHRVGQYFPIASLSESETISLHLDLAFAAARQRSNAPQVLVINNLLLAFDDDNVKRFDRVCKRLPPNVQVVLLDSKHRLGHKLGWHTERLSLETGTFPYPVDKVQAF
jgi:hypothetical protein